MTEVKLPKNRMNGDDTVDLAHADTPKTRSDVPLPSPLPQEPQTVPRGKGTGRRDDASPDDDTAEIPFFGRISGGFLNRLDKLGIGVLVILIVSGFGWATLSWGATHVGEPLIKAEVDAKEKTTAAAIEKDKAITETQRQLTAVISQLVQTVEAQRIETNRKEAVDRESWKQMSASLQSIQLSLQELVASDHKRSRENN